jgi:reverse gyrase
MRECSKCHGEIESSRPNSALCRGCDEAQKEKRMLDKEKLLPEERRHRELIEALLNVSDKLEKLEKEMKAFNDCFSSNNKRSWWDRLRGQKDVAVDESVV